MGGGTTIVRRSWWRWPLSSSWSSSWSSSTSSSTLPYTRGSGGVALLASLSTAVATILSRPTRAYHPPPVAIGVGLSRHRFLSPYSPSSLSSSSSPLSLSSSCNQRRSWLISPRGGGGAALSSSSSSSLSSSSSSSSSTSSSSSSSPPSFANKSVSYSSLPSSRKMSSSSSADGDANAGAADATNTNKIDAPFGSWISPITSKAITAGSISLGSLRCEASSSSSSSSSSTSTSKRDLYWIEGRPKEGGRYVLCRHVPTPPDGGQESAQRNAVDVTPPGTNARTRVHEYGGGSVSFGHCGDVYYSDFATQHLMKITTTATKTTNVHDHDSNEAGNDPIPLIPDVQDGRYRFADGRVSGNDLFVVREDHTNPSPRDVVNEIVAVTIHVHVDKEGAKDAEAEAEAETAPQPEPKPKPKPETETEKKKDNKSIPGSMRTIATGKDFYASPRPSADGTMLAYVTWDHPNMPWDATELRVVHLTHKTFSNDQEARESAKSDGHALVAGGDGDASVMQPLWHPATGDLFYISDETGYYNIYRARLATEGSGEGSWSVVNVLPMEYDFGGSSPGWVLGQQGFTFLDDGRLAATYNRDGRTRLIVADVASGDGEATDVVEYGGGNGNGTDHDGLPMQFGGIVSAGDGSGDVYFVGGSPSVPTSIYKWNIQSRHPAEILVCSSSLSYDPEYISVPTQVEFPTVLGTAFGYYYPPQNGRYECKKSPEGSLPPLLVKAHGGPTSCASTSFNPTIQYWTSRGFAILDVNYGGSTGYGRSYRRRLRGNWGVVDVDDVCAGATYLAKKGLVDGNRLCIDGGSAGGYTTLSALAFRDVFSAGCSLYGIGDLTALAGDTHKFESRYLDGLVGPYPQEEALYKERSPIESVDSLSCPILLLQGKEDKVVPPNQAEMMYDALKSKGLRTCLKIYDGEQHGFRKAENIEDALDSELAFYGKVFGIDVPDAVELDIDNM